MLGIVNDPDSHAQFAVLLLGRLDSDRLLRLVGSAYVRNGGLLPVLLELEEQAPLSRS